MTILARGWLLVRRVMRKRPPKHHLRANWGGFRVQTHAVSSEGRSVSKPDQDLGTIATSKAVKKQQMGNVRSLCESLP